MGNEWRPLKEQDKYKRENPFLDPKRGRIANAKTKTDGTAEVTT